MFKSISIAITVVALALGGAASVEAKKFGGGKSVGTQRTAPTSSPSASPTSAVPASAATAAPAAAAAAAAPKTGMAKWAGPLAGIAAGLGLGYLFSQMGGGGASSMLMMVLLAGLVIGGLLLVARMFMRKQNPNMASSGGSVTPSSFGAPQQRIEPTSFTGTSAAGGAAVPLAMAAAATNLGIPADFDKAGFEANAKSQFIALQAANDKGNLDAVRDFATDDFYNQIAKDVVGGNKDATHVDELHAELMGIETERGQYWASVQFTGKMREDGMMMASDFRETWNLTKPVDGSKGWLLAGIQQT